MKWISAIVLALTLLGCSFSYTHHDEELAANTAADFLDAAFLSRTSDRGYSFFADQAKAAIPYERLLSACSLVDSNDPLQGFKAYGFRMHGADDLVEVYFFIRATRGEGYWQVTLIGDEKKYQVMGFKTLNEKPVLTDAYSDVNYESVHMNISRGSPALKALSKAD